MEVNNEENVYVQRVSQLDARDLDRELHSLLQEQVTKTFKYVKPRYWSAVEPELDAILQLIVLGFSATKFHATVGQQLLNIKYRDEKTLKSPTNKRLLVFVAGLVGAHWLKAREDYLTLWLSSWPNTRKVISRTLEWSEITIRSAMVANLLWFLLAGKFPLPVERILGLRQIPASPQNIRQVSYEYLNRELLWHGFAEFLAFLVPLVNIKRLINKVCRWLPLVIDDPTSESQRTREDLTHCGICDQSPTLPHCIGCRHVFCYYCIKSNVLSDSNYRCPKCGLQIQHYYPIKQVCI